MKKSTILGSLALTLTLSLGLALPSYATNNNPNTASTAPSREAILQMIAHIKSLDGYYEYSNLVNAVENRSAYNLERALGKIDPSLITTGQTTDELVKSATSLKDYGAFVYLIGLVNYTENWLSTSYDRSSTASQLEAYDALSDAVTVARLTIKDPLNKQRSTAKNTSKGANSLSQSTSSKASQASTPKTVATTAKASAEAKASISTNKASQTTGKTANSNEQDQTSTKTAQDESNTSGSKISVTVAKNPEEVAILAHENSTNDASENQSEGQEDKTSPLTTGLTCTAATFGLAGAALITKREVTRRAGHSSRSATRRYPKSRRI